MESENSIATLSVTMSASMHRTFMSKGSYWKMTDIEQILSDRVEMELREDLQLKGQENNFKKDVSLDLVCR